MKEDSALKYKRGENKPFFQKANEHTELWTNGTNSLSTLQPRPSINDMATFNVLIEALPCVILVMLETNEIVEVASMTQCSIDLYPGLVKPIIFIKLRRTRIKECNPTGIMSDDMGLLED